MIAEAQKKSLILLVDDIQKERRQLIDLLQQIYTVIVTETAVEASSIIESNLDDIAAIILDLDLKNNQGIKLLKRLHSERITQKISIVVISSDEDRETMLTCLAYGAAEFLSKPIDLDLLETFISKAVDTHTKQKVLFESLVEQIKQRDRRTSFLIYVLSQVIRQSNSESGDHILNVRMLTRIVLESLQKVSDKYTLSDEEIAAISLAACLHDIGKTLINNDILNKPTKLTEEEFKEVQKHTVFGANMLDEYEDFKDDSLVMYAKDICRWHHEKWDGSGYPDKLVGDQIPIWAQAVSIADCYDALTSKRCYKKQYSHETALEMLVNGECGEFNPDVIQAFIIASEGFKSKKEQIESIEVDAELDAKRFAESILRNYKQFL